MEARAAPRISVDLPVSFVSEEGPGEGTIYNISEGGCAVQTTSHVPEQTYVRLQVPVPDGGPPVNIDFASVRWSTRDEFGLKFLQMRGEGRSRLERWLRKMRADALSKQNAGAEG